MSVRHECFPEPRDRNAKLWRYVDLSKFLALLKTKSLYFCRSDLLGDPHEGSNSVAGKRQLELFQKLLLEHRHTMPTLESYRSMTDDQVIRFVSMHTNLFQNVRKLMYVNCWHMNNYESYAMWKVYSQSPDSICIQTTFAQLFDAFPENYYVGAVKYLDYEIEVVPASNAFFPVMHKRKYFEYEQEVRAVHCLLGVKDINNANSPGSVETAIDLRALINAIYVNPFGPRWLLELVKDICEKYGLDVPIKQSSIATEPVF